MWEYSWGSVFAPYLRNELCDRFGTIKTSTLREHFLPFQAWKRSQKKERTLEAPSAERNSNSIATIGALAFDGALERLLLKSLQPVLGHRCETFVKIDGVWAVLTGHSRAGLWVSFFSPPYIFDSCPDPVWRNNMRLPNTLNGSKIIQSLNIIHHRLWCVPCWGERCCDTLGSDRYRIPDGGTILMAYFSCPLVCSFCVPYVCTRLCFAPSRFSIKRTSGRSVSFFMHIESIDLMSLLFDEWFNKKCRSMMLFKYMSSKTSPLCALRYCCLLSASTSNALAKLDGVFLCACGFWMLSFPTHQHHRYFHHVDRSSVWL